ncbi:hypothetical protein D051_3454 [Vibrio parahaemolyticus VPCR-2010]|nr:hypothetical protein VPBB_1109 [Vibrio parahaemolyticus BB22OP]ANZ09793.1 hypothetical protein VpaChn25_1192 [Vibrio parahaemolyticus]EDM59992.1 hypothetical protein A79_0179 [Vibrio parahaemolyticus AQ3810]EFO52702.1 conserved hypothetical protein [Vibrio parahaemolyticus K5030]EQL88670.1 hypothetical protein D052_2704 [Vibrio parahaemolyticus 10290]EQL95385.1 hypothetical protein D035_1782 [Vibrio parahaemolyticus VP250]EQL98051.1 hypothetical protein D036_3089 [Vibrio parahaemolyticus V
MIISQAKDTLTARRFKTTRKVTPATKNQYSPMPVRVRK